jgi:hypothetical protein
MASNLDFDIFICATNSDVQNIPGRKKTGAKDNPQIIPATKELSLFNNIKITLLKNL